MDEHLSRRYIAASLMQSTRDSNEAGSLLSLLDLAPDGGCLAACIAAGAGGLLHHLFTISLTPPPWERERVRVVCFCGPTNSFALRLAIPDVIRHPALWSADFPRPPEGDRAHPTSLVNSSYYYG